MRVLVGILAAAMAAAGDAWAADVATCGATVPAGATGALTADLNCAGGSGAAVTLEPGATLEMNGRSIAGGAIGVACPRSCTIRGPGTISGCSLYGVDAWTPERGSIRISGVTIDGCGHGIVDFECTHRVTAIDVAVVNSGQYGIYARSIRATNADFSGNQWWGVWACTRFTGTNVTAGENQGAGIGAGTAIRGNQVSAGDNQGAGLTAGTSVRVDTLIAQGNANAGVVSRGWARIVNSVVTGNRYSGQPMDVVSLRRPRFGTSTCGRSGQLILDGNAFVVGDPWGICASD